MVMRAACWTAVVLAAAAAGCGKGEEAAKEDAEAKAAALKAGAAEDLPGEVFAILRTFPASTSGGVPEATKTVLRDQAHWDALWAQANSHLAPVPKAPTVDFTKEMVAFAAMGRRKSAGYSVEIVGARQDGGNLHLLVAERDPSKGSAVAQVETSPWHAVVLRKSDLPIVWDPYEAPGTGKEKGKGREKGKKR
jgi:hypothetical protein